MALLAFPSTDRARKAYASLRITYQLPPSLASRAVHDLERAQSAQIRACVLEALSEIPIPDRQIWLDAHGYADCCQRCGRVVRSSESLELDPLTLRIWCSRCRLTRQLEEARDEREAELKEETHNR